MEKEPDNQDTINEIFRAAHSLKGMAGTMGYTRMQRLTHDMENVFSEIRNGNMTASDDLVDVLFKGLDALENYLDNIVETAAEGTEDNEDIITRLNEILEIGTGKMKEAPKEEKKAVSTKAPVKAEEKPVADEKAKYTSFTYAEHERNAISSAAEQNMKVYGILMNLSALLTILFHSCRSLFLLLYRPSEFLSLYLHSLAIDTFQLFCLIQEHRELLLFHRLNFHP